MFNFIKNIAQTKDESKKGKVIALMNQKGGVGKTTMAFNLAHAFAKNGKKVLALDMDPQGNFSSLFGVEKRKFHIHHLLINSVKELRALHTPVVMEEVMVKVGEKIDLLPAGQELSGFELTVAGINHPRQLILKRFLEKENIRDRYDVVVIDGPPTLGLIVVNIMCATDGVLYPFVPDRFSEQGLKNMQEVVRDIKEMGICEAPVTLGYIPNLFDQRRKQTHKDFEKIKGECEEGFVFDPFFNKVQFGKTLAMGKSIFDYKGSDYTQLQGQFSKMIDVLEERWQ